MLFSGLDDFFGLSDRSGFPRALGKKHLKEKSTRHWKFACSVSYPRLPPHSLYCSRWLGSSLSAETLFETLGLARDHGCGGHDVHGRGLEKPLTLPPFPCSLWHHRPWWKIITIVKLDPDLLHWDHHQHIITHSPPFAWMASASGSTSSLEKGRWMQLQYCHIKLNLLPNSMTIYGAVFCCSFERQKVNSVCICSTATVQCVFQLSPVSPVSSAVFLPVKNGVQCNPKWNPPPLSSGVQLPVQRSGASWKG